MSFGYRDEDWIEPEEHISCYECDNWWECPDGCGWGWCIEHNEFMRSGEYCS